MVLMDVLPIFGVSLLIVTQVCIKPKSKKAKLLSELVNIFALSLISSFSLRGVENNFLWKHPFVSIKCLAALTATFLFFRFLFTVFQIKREQLKQYEEEREAWVIKTTGRKSEF